MAAHVKLFAEVTVPLGVLTEIGPVLGQASAGTTARILVELSTVNAAEVPLNLISVAPVNPLPRISTLVSTGPLLGEKLLNVAAHVKLFAEVAVPLDVLMTEIGPVLGQAPAGTVARILVELSTVNAAEVPLN